jgi:alpha-tubulin suppressor-like RCC1 family protein
MLWSKSIPIIISLVILATNRTAAADWREDAKAIDISGGENHTLVLTQNKWPWACGDNYYGELGNGQTGGYEATLIRVHGVNNIGYLQDINDVDAGWTHSLGLDINGLLWSWGWNEEGQLGNDGYGPYQTNPVQVHGGQMGSTYLEDIITISAGRSGRQSIAVDANHLVYAWGYNKYGQCGNGQSGNNKLTPVRVLSGEQDPNNADTLLQYIVAVSAGADQSMALDANGLVYTWGTYFVEGFDLHLRTNLV